MAPVPVAEPVCVRGRISCTRCCHQKGEVDCARYFQPQPKEQCTAGNKRSESTAVVELTAYWKSSRRQMHTPKLNLIQRLDLYVIDVKKYSMAMWIWRQQIVARIPLPASSSGSVA